MTGKLARVSWELGQTLLPDHFVAQEEALALEASTRSRLQGLPAHGIGNLRWNDTLLVEGVLSIQALTLVMPSGTLVEIPGNARVEPLNLNVPGTVSVAAYCHLLKTCRDEARGAEEAGSEVFVPRMVHPLVLSCEQSFQGALETMKLGEFHKEPEGAWHFVESYIPPLLEVGTSPFLEHPLVELLEALELFQYKLMQDAASYLSGSSLFAVKHCLMSVYRMRRFLGNLRGQVHPHPYQVYEALSDFYIDVCFYRETAPKHVTEAYNHDQLGASFLRILDPLREQMHLAQKRSPYLPFEFRDGVYQLELPPEFKDAQEIYFLVQKSQVNRVVTLDNFKLAAASRLSLVHKLALQGIPVKRIDRPMLAHSFGPEVDFFLVAPGEEWDHALREGKVAFYNAAEFEDMEFYLYWHLG